MYCDNTLNFPTPAELRHITNAANKLEQDFADEGFNSIFEIIKQAAQNGKDCIDIFTEDKRLKICNSGEILGTLPVPGAVDIKFYRRTIVMKFHQLGFRTIWLNNGTASSVVLVVYW